MTDTERRNEIRALIKEYTAANTATKDLAVAALKNEGIYDRNGRLKAEFGGKQPKTGAKQD